MSMACRGSLFRVEGLVFRIWGLGLGDTISRLTLSKELPSKPEAPAS